MWSFNSQAFGIGMCEEHKTFHLCATKALKCCKKKSVGRMAGNQKDSERNMDNGSTAYEVLQQGQDSLKPDLDWGHLCCFLKKSLTAWGQCSEKLSEMNT